MTSALAFLLAAQSPGNGQIPIAYREGIFLVGLGAAVETVPVRPPAPPRPRAVSFRRGGRYVVWDTRGLTVRTGRRVRSTRMPEVAVTPRLFARTEILRTLELVRTGTRTKNAAALSGARRVGSRIYFLLRWMHKKTGVPWLEALVVVDLAQKEPKPQLLGRFEGLSLATKSIDDQMFVLSGRLAVVTRRDGPVETWGISTFDTGRKAFESRPYGARLVEFRPVGVRGGLFVERTDWGTSVAGRVDFVGKARRDLLEGRGPLRLLDAAKPPLAALGTPPSRTLRNGDTGAVLPLPPSSAARRTAQGILVWSPADSPTSATLYEPSRWEVRGRWTREREERRG